MAQTRRLTEHSAEGQPIQRWHHHVEHGQVERFRCQGFERAQPIGGFNHVVSIAGECSYE
jgi:hypothetical protein